MEKLLAMVNSGEVKTVIVAKLDRLTRSVKDLCALLELFEKRKMALISLAESPRRGLGFGSFRGLAATQVAEGKRSFRKELQ
jgi:DNA invertase Pin-like site-specific DNA recombinase